MKHILYIFLCLYSPATLFAQEVIVDSTTLYYERNLLQNKFIQFFATKAMNDTYNFKFTQAENQFKWLQEKYPEHPLPYFLLGLNESWKMMPNPDDAQYDEVALAYFDQAIDYAYKLQRGKEENLDASFFLASAYSFKSRIHSDRGHWSRAIFAGRKALMYLRYAEKWEELSPEWLLGEGLYNYYSVWIAENYTLMRPVIAMFKRGNQETGLKQLHKASEESFFVRIEAQQFLMRIYYHIDWSDANKSLYLTKALAEAKYLHTSFPDNPYFQRYYLATCYHTGDWQEAYRVGQDALHKIEQKTEGYEAVTGRWTTYFLGNIANNYQGNTTEAKRYFDMTVVFAEAIEAYESGYYKSALQQLGRLAEKANNYPLAKKYYAKLRKYASRKSDEYKEAKKKTKAYKRNKVED